MFGFVIMVSKQGGCGEVDGRAGGTRSVAGMDEVLVTADPLVPGDVARSVEDPRAGAVAMFYGTTRNTFHGKGVVRLEYEAYDAMASAHIKKLCAETREKWVRE